MCAKKKNNTIPYQGSLSRSLHLNLPIHIPSIYTTHVTGNTMLMPSPLTLHLAIYIYARFLVCA